jgi:hypothetical protein
MFDPEALVGPAPDTIDEERGLMRVALTLHRVGRRTLGEALSPTA